VAAGRRGMELLEGYARMTDLKGPVDDLVGDELPCPFHPRKNHIRHGGMPPKFATAELLRIRIDEYFASLAPKRGRRQLPDTTSTCAVAR